MELDTREALITRIREVANGMEAFGPDFDPDVRIADPRHGDYQANGVLAWAKQKRQNPRLMAQQLVEGIQRHFDGKRVPWGKLEIAGPGFINFEMDSRWLLDWLLYFGCSDHLETAAKSIVGGRKIVVDFSSPNTAKQMHVGHIRSTVIGDAICRILEFCGASVIRDNHIGDWGTQFGILIMILKRIQVDLDSIAGDPIAVLEDLYRKGSALTQVDPSALDEARAELVKLQGGDSENLKIWRAIVDISYGEFIKIYDRLDVRFDHVLGESFYRDQVERVCSELEEDGIASESQGALVVFHPEHPRFATQPFIIRKSDGASNYATTDLATALYRHEHFAADEVINVTDARQKDHFEQLELTVRKWFEKRGRKLPVMKHVTFGTILGPDGKAIKTRSGENVKLRELLDEACERARAITAQKNPELSGAELDAISTSIGIASVRYADLSQNRSSDYQFDWDKMLSFEGNTAPYLLYVSARIHGILRKSGGVWTEPGRAANRREMSLETPTEVALAKRLMQVVVVLKQTLEDLRPHYLGAYLYDLCADFNAFYHNDVVLHEDSNVRELRMHLCASTLSILKRGLGLLGIPVLERM